MQKQIVDNSVILLESIKILGPALLTATVSYLITRNQTKMKSEEIKNECEYKARENIFKIYQDKIKTGQETFKNANTEIAKVIGQIAASDPGHKIDSYRFLLKLISLGEENIKTYLHDTYSQLQQHELLNPYYNSLFEQAYDFLKINLNNVPDEGLEKVFYAFYQLSIQFPNIDQTLLDHRSNELFAKYIKD